jgi:hypothetical protein
MLNVTQIPADRVAFIDEKTGRVSREWYRFLLNLFMLTGGGSSNVTLTDLMVGPPPTTAEGQIAEIQKAIQALALNPPPPSAAEIINIVYNRLQDLEVGPSLSGLLSDIAVLQSQMQSAAVAPSDSSLRSDIAVLQSEIQSAAIAPDNSSLVSEVALIKTAIQALEQAQPVIPTILPATLGTVTSVNVSGGSTGITFSGGPITTAGTITMAGTLGTANGGTGSTSSTFVNLASNVTGTLPIANGGTGTTSTTFVNLTSNVTSVLPIANGGTNTTATPNAGGIAYGTGSAYAFTTGVASTYGQMLIYNPTSGLPQWSNVAQSTVFATSDGAGGANAFFDETAGFGRIGGTNGIILCTGSPRPGTSRFVVDPNTFRPFTDNVSALGTASFRYTVVYATTGTINTSDGNQKQQIAELTTAEQAVAKRIKSLIRTFKFNDAVEAKGDGARVHVGVIAQDVRDAFVAEGLDPTRYGLFCSDTWTEDSVEHTRLGVRYDQLLAFVIAAI